MSGAFMGIPTLALSASAVTASDSTVITTTKSLFVGVQGDVAVVLSEDGDSVVFKDVVGFLPVMAKQVLSTGTTATDILALY